MGERISLVHAGQVPVGTKVTIEGWIRTRRDSKAGLSFLAISDGSCQDPLQIVAPKELANYDSEIVKLTAGCAVRAIGELVASQGKGQAFEVRADSVEVVGWVEDPDTYPMQPKRHTMEYLREQAHLRARTNTIGAVMRVRNTIAQAVHRFFHERGFFWIHTPIITTSDAEGAGQMFRVSTLDFANLPRTPDGKVDFDQDFFGKEVRLTVSGQLNVETYAMALSRVYTFGPTFRAENSNTRRHLAEFWMIEPEIAFADLAADAQLAEDFLKYIFKAALDERADDMAFFDKAAEEREKERAKEKKEKGASPFEKPSDRLRKVVDTKFARMDYGDAITALEQSGRKFDFPVKWGIDLQSEHEKFLTDEVVKGPVAVVNYPKDIKAFYMRLNADEKTVAAMDVLAPGIGEIIGGSQREERLDVLDRRIGEMGLHAADYGWYRDLRRYGTVPHAGFGLGFERAIIYATGIENIRDVIPFPRATREAEF